MGHISKFCDPNPPMEWVKPGALNLVHGLWQVAADFKDGFSCTWPLCISCTVYTEV